MFVYFYYNHLFGSRNACIISEGITFLYDIIIWPSGNFFYCVFPFMFECVHVCVCGQRRYPDRLLSPLHYNPEWQLLVVEAILSPPGSIMGVCLSLEFVELHRTSVITWWVMTPTLLLTPVFHTTTGHHPAEDSLTWPSLSLVLPLLFAHQSVSHNLSCFYLHVFCLCLFLFHFFVS